MLMWSGWVQGNSNGPLVPMVRLVPIEKHPIPMVLLVNMHLIIKGDLDYLLMWSGWVQGNSNGTIGTNGTIGANRKASYSNGSIGEYASH